MTSILVLGFLIGVRHAFEPDHVAAVAALATRATSLKHAVRQGAVWGFGHTITLFVICGVVLALNTTISDDIAYALEAAVGVVLVILGVDVMRRVYHDRVHFHAHDHAGGVTHFHAHSHKGEVPISHDPARHEHEHAITFPYRSLVVGLMHGMAGSAALIVLAIQTVQSVWQGLAYIALFGIGSIAGMALLSVIISIPMRNARTLTWVHNGLQATVGGITAVLGIIIVIDSLVS